MALEGGLHAHVPLGRDVVRGDEEALAPSRALRRVPARLPPRGEVVHQLFAVEAAAPSPPRGSSWLASRSVVSFAASSASR